MSNTETTVATPTVTTRKGATIYRNLKDRDGRHMGRAYTGTLYAGQHADVVHGRSIRLHGTDASYRKPAMPHDLTFEIGSSAAYDSYNLVSTGPIVKISAKTVSILDDNGSIRRLSISEFNRRNSHFDAEKIAKRNGDFLD